MRHGAAGGAVHGGWYPLSLRRTARRAGEELCDAGGRARSRLPHSRGRGLWETRPCWENQEGRRRNSERELGGTGSRLDGDCPDGRRDCRKVRTAEGFRETDEPWWRLSRHDTGPGFGLRDLNKIQVLRDGKASQVKVSSGLSPYPADLDRPTQTFSWEAKGPDRLSGERPGDGCSHGRW